MKVLADHSSDGYDIGEAGSDSMTVIAVCYDVLFFFSFVVHLLNEASSRFDCKNLFANIS
jgi:hypothetical protein